jgi:hypothetical protein
MDNIAPSDAAGGNYPFLPGDPMGKSSRSSSAETLRYTAENDPRVKAIVNQILPHLTKPGGDADMRAAMSMIASQIFHRSGNSASVLTYGAMQAIGTSGMNMTFQTANAGKVDPSKTYNGGALYGPGALTNAFARTAFQDFSNNFYPGGMANFAKLKGMNMSDAGQMFNEMGRRGAFAGRLEGIHTYDTATGRAEVTFSESSKQKMQSMMEDAAATLKSVRDVFGSKPARELMQIAESITGQSFTSLKGSQNIRRIFTEGTARAQAFGYDARSYLEQQGLMSQYVGTITGSQKFGQIISERMAFQNAYSAGAINADANRASDLGVYQTAYDPMAQAAAQGKHAAQVHAYDKEQGNQLQVLGYISQTSSLSDKQRAQLKAAAASIGNAVGGEAQMRARSAANDLIKTVSGRDISYFHTLNLENRLSLDTMRDFVVNNVAQMDANGLEQNVLGGQFQEISDMQLKIKSTGDPEKQKEQATALARNLYRNTTSEQRGKLISKLSKSNSKNGIDVNEAVDAMGLPAEQAAALKASLGQSSLTGKDLARAIAQGAASLAGGAQGASWFTGAGSAEAVAAEAKVGKQRLMDIVNSVDAKGGNMGDMFMAGLLGDSPYMQNNGVAAAALAAKSSSFAVGFDRSTGMLTGVDEAAVAGMKSMGVNIQGMEGKSDAEIAAYLNSNPGAAQQLMAAVDASGGILGFADGKLTGVSKEETDRLQSERQRQEILNVESALTGKKDVDKQASADDSWARTMQAVGNGDFVNRLLNKNTSATVTRALGSLTSEQTAAIDASLAVQQKQATKQEDIDKIQKARDALQANAKGKQFLGVLKILGDTKELLLYEQK